MQGGVKVAYELHMLVMEVQLFPTAIGPRSQVAKTLAFHAKDAVSTTAEVIPILVIQLNGARLYSCSLGVGHFEDWWN